MLILEDLFLSVTSLRFRAHRYSKHVHSVGKVVIFTGLLVSDVRVSVLGFVWSDIRQLTHSVRYELISTRLCWSLKTHKSAFPVDIRIYSFILRLR